MSIYTKLTIIFVLINLCGCATVTPVSKISHLTWAERQQQLSAISTWDIASSVGIQYPNGSASAHVNWQQLSNKYTIFITSPLNIGGVKIVGDNQKVELWKSSTEKISAANPEILMMKELGWSLPLENMRYWIKGVPVPKLPNSSQLNSYNQLILLKQSGWNIQYVSYQTVNNIDLPEKIFLTNNQLKVKIVIKNWRLD